MDQVIKIFFFVGFFLCFSFSLFSFSFFLVIMNCKKCKYKILYLGSNQNGYYYLCKKCNNVIPTNEKINKK